MLLNDAPPATDTTGRLDTSESFAKSLFTGEILFGNAFPYPRMSERDRELLAMMVDSIDHFMDGKDAALRDMDRDGAQPAEYVQELRELGLFGLVIPEAYDGIGLSNAGYARVLSQTSRYDSSTSLTIGAHSSIGMKGLLLFGTPEQKSRYLPRLASGEMIAAFCLTESGAGSDAASIRTSARKQPDGSWILNGEKIWITNGGIADLYTVFARTEGPGGKISAFIVEAAWPGVSRGHHEDKMGIRGSSTTTVTFADVRVPAENLLGEEGKGFKAAMAILNSGRTGLGGGAVGGMKTLIALATKQATERKQFGRPIAEFGLVREKIAQMTVDCFAAESTVWMIAHYIDSECDDYSVEAAIGKVFAGEAVNRAAWEALQIAGGNGYMREYPYEQAARDARILPIFEGANEVMRLFIGLSGLKHAGSQLSEVKSAVDDIFSNPIKGFGVLGSYAQRRIARATGLRGDKAPFNCPAELKESLAIYQKYASALATASEQLLRQHRKAVIERQADLKRVADVAIDLFVGLCTLSRAISLGADTKGDAAQGREIARVFAQQAKRRMASNLRRLAGNEDQSLDRLAGNILADGQYRWDVL
ncbi:MAG: acyl-CoA dehydrogenase family protein [Gammaproteobacteria bacterium]|nr:acyl-CoA dehydrogenase family protein [Gammaproteobacteria bacterium]